MTDEVRMIKSAEVKLLPEWAKWKGEGPEPKKWQAVDPEGNSTTVYRTYADYCDD